jgi:hypothetical protein
MIEFDVNKLRVETFKVKALTTALGGSITILDEEETDRTGKEVFHRMKVPMSVVRAFQVRHKTMKYIRPCLVAVALYEDRAIALERHPAGCMGERLVERLETDGNGWAKVEKVMKKWIPSIEFNIDNTLRPLMNASRERNEKWFFDGRYIFTFDGMTVDQAIAKGTPLSEDKRFRCVDVDAIGLHKLEEKSKLDPIDRTCLAYVAKNGQYAVSPPIWKNARQVGEAKIKGIGKKGEGERDFNFDTVDGHCAVNISFALKAANQLSREFGFEAIEPLNLPALMVRLNTVNLPKIPSEVKDTFDSGMKFTHALAWLLGFARRCNDLETYASIRSLLKYLTSSGLFLKSAFDPQNIFKKGHDLESIPLLSKNEALENIETMSLEERLNMIRDRRNVSASRVGNVVGGALHVDEDD